MNLGKSFFSIGVCSLLLSSTAIAKTSNWYEGYYQRQLDKIKSAKKSRTVASSFELTEANFKNNRAELYELVNKVLKIKSAPELHSFITDLDHSYDQGKLKLIDTKFYVLQLSSLLPLKSLAWRVDKLLGNRIFDGNLELGNVAQGSLVTALGSAASWNVLFTKFNGNDQWEAGFDYVTRPYAHTALKPRTVSAGCESHKFGQVIKSGEELRAFIRCELLPSVEKAETRMTALLKELEGQNNYSIIWDSKLIFGQSSFVAGRGNSLERFKSLAMSDVHSVLSGIQLAKHNLIVSSMYRLDGIKSIMSKMGDQLALDRDDNGSVEALSARQRHRILTGQSRFLTLDKKAVKNGNGEDNFKLAWESLQNSYRAGRLVWEELKSKKDSADPENEQLTLNPFFVRPFVRVGDLAQDNLDNLILRGGTHSFVSVTTGKVISANMENMYKKVNDQYVGDFKDFLPSGFEMGDRNYKKRIPGLGKVKFRNYRYGRATSWDHKAYQRVFPTVKSSSDLKEAVRTMSAVYGGMMIVSPVAFGML